MEDGSTVRGDTIAVTEASQSALVPGDSCLDQQSSAMFLLAGAVVVVAEILHLSVVNWGGDQVAWVGVLPSDTVLVGQKQIEDQTGCPPWRQRLVFGEQQLDSEMMLWSECKTLGDGSTLQLTMVTDEQTGAPNIFDSVVLEAPHVTDCGHSRTRGAPKTEIICGSVGIALTPFSGKQGFFDAVVTSEDFSTSTRWIGVSTIGSCRSLRVEEQLVGGVIWEGGVHEDGGVDGSIVWTESGEFISSLLGIPHYHRDKRYDNINSSGRETDSARFGKGDIVGIMICCLGNPTISFVRNGIVIHKIVPCHPDALLALHPAFPIIHVNSTALCISANPTIPLCLFPPDV